VFETLGLFVAARIAGGVEFIDEFLGILITGVALAVAVTFVKPIISILILPLSLATLGLFGFLAHAITLYLVDLVLPQFQVTRFHFNGFSSSYLTLPSYSTENLVIAYLLFSLLISFITGVLHWVSK